MFKIVSNPTFTHTVTVMTPSDGGYEREELKVTYNLLDTVEMAKYDMRNAADTDAFLKAGVRSLDDLVDDKGNALPPSDALRDQVLRLPHVRHAVVQGYVTAVTKAAEGN